jgi:DNA-binding NarL/FixJ family response regulator
MTIIDRALIVDDHSLYRRGLCILLKDHFLCSEIAEASNYSEAERYLSESPSFDLALFDLAMPGMGRPMTLAPLRAKYPKSKFAIVAASESKDDVIEAVAAGLSGFIPKTLSSIEFIRALKSIMEGQIYVPGHMLHYEPNVPVGPKPLPAEAQLSMTIDSLTPRQHDVLNCVRRGLSNREIAGELAIAIGTVKIHVATLLTSLKVSNRVQLALY